MKQHLDGKHLDPARARPRALQARRLVARAPPLTASLWLRAPEQHISVHRVARGPLAMGDLSCAGALKRRRGEAPSGPETDDEAGSDADSTSSEPRDFRIEDLALRWSYDTDDEVERGWVDDSAMRYEFNHTWLPYDWYGAEGNFFNAYAHMQWDAALATLVDVHEILPCEINRAPPRQDPTAPPTREELRMQLGPHNRRCKESINICEWLITRYAERYYGEEQFPHNERLSDMLACKVSDALQDFCFGAMKHTFEVVKDILEPSGAPMMNLAVNPITSAYMFRGIERLLLAQGFAIAPCVSVLNPNAPLLSDDEDDESLASADVRSEASAASDAEHDEQIELWSEEAMLERFGFRGCDYEGMSRDGWSDPDDEVGRWNHSPGGIDGVFSKAQAVAHSRSLGIDDLVFDVPGPASLLMYFPVLCQFLEHNGVAAPLHPFTNRALALFVTAAQRYAQHRFGLMIFLLNLEKHGKNRGPFACVPEDALEIIFSYV